MRETPNTLCRGHVVACQSQTGHGGTEPIPHFPAVLGVVTTITECQQYVSGIKYSEFISVRLILTLPSNLHFDQPKLRHVTSHGNRRYVQIVKSSLCNSIN